MKKLLFILFSILCFAGYSQEYIPINTGYGFELKTSSELNALTKKAKGDIFFNNTSERHVYWDGSSFQTFGTGGTDFIDALSPIGDFDFALGTYALLSAETFDANTILIPTDAYPGDVVTTDGFVTGLTLGLSGSDLTLTATRNGLSNVVSNTIALPSGGGVSNGDKGDIIVSGSGDVWLYEAGSINSEDIASNAITLFKMADGSVDTAELVNGAVTTTKIEDGAITQAKLNSAFYEEDEFTPALVDNGGGATYSASVSSGDYVKVGDQVTFTIFFNIINTTSSPTGELRITGLPYAAMNGANFSCNVSTYTGGNISFYSISAEVISNTSTIYFRYQDSLDTNLSSNMSSVTFSGGSIRLTGTYIAQ